MKSLLLGLLTVIAANSFALVGDTGKIGVMYFSNTSNEDVILVASDRPNDSGFAKFKCLYQIPKEHQPLPSPSFHTMMDPTSENGASMQYALISKGTSVAYAFNSMCDDENDNTRSKFEIFSIRSKTNFNDVYIAGKLHQDLNNGIIAYNDWIRVSALTANVHSASIGISPFQVTILPYPELANNLAK